MGVAAGNLLYDIGPAVPLKTNYHWLLFDGYKKDDKPDREQVTIFKFIKSKEVDNILLNAANRYVQKVRTIKHPYVLSYLDSSIQEDSILLVTEYGKPLDLWFSNFSTSSDSTESKELSSSLTNDIVWGLYCVCTALEFLHSKCKISHNNLSPNSIFVVPNGDWKIGSFDFASQTGSSDEGLTTSTLPYLEKAYMSPEVMKGSVSGSYEADVYSLSKIIYQIFDKAQIPIPSDMEKLLRKMSSTEPKRRPSALQIQSSKEFNSEYIKLLINLSDIALKSPVEVQDLLQKLTNQASQFSRAICSHRILKILSQRLRIAVAEFANRDFRENSRQIIQSIVTLISTFGELGKIDDDMFRLTCVPVFNDLWSMSDRTVRHSLLRGSKVLIALTPTPTVNKNVFDAMVAGFADSNPKMREETLRNLIYIVDKLDEKQLQDRLLRCVSLLQNDAENSIRTNATIFLGRIAPKLKESTRNRILWNAFAKAMRDSFSHCRIAGLKSAIACLDMIDVQQLATVLLPQSCTMLVDRNPEIRQLSLTFIDSSLVVLRGYSERMLNTAVEEKDERGSKSESSSTQSTSVWTSWAVEGLSKTFERVTLSDTTKSTDSRVQTPGGIRSPEASMSDDFTHSKAFDTPSSGRDSRVDLGNVDVTSPKHLANYKPEDQKASKLSSSLNFAAEVDTELSTARLTYNDDDMDANPANWADDDFAWEEDDSSTAKTSITYGKFEEASITEKPNKSVEPSPKVESFVKLVDTTNVKSKAKTPKLSAVKLGAESDDNNWDDF